MKKIHNKKQFIFLFIIMLLILFFTIIISITIGSANIGVVDSFKVVLSKIPILQNFVDISDIPKTSIIIINNIRLPRILLAGLVGLALASSGAVYQGVLKNSMADPYILGVSSGAALGATLAIISNTFNIKLLSFIISIFTTFFVYFVSRNNIKGNNTSIILTGININYFITALISLLMILNKDKLDRIVYWTMGSFSTSSWSNVIVAAFSVIPCIISISIFGKYINALALNEDVAKNVGVNTILLKKILIIIVSFMTSICVSISGIIGFVGLMIPHIIRLLFTSDYRYIIPISRSFWCNISNHIR